MAKIKNKNGVPLYTKSVYIGTVDGRAKYTTISARTAEELRQKVAQLKRERNRAKKNDTMIYSTADFNTMAAEWLQVKKAGNVSTATYKEYQSAISHLQRKYSGKKIPEINYNSFQSFINDLARENPNTRRPASKKLLRDIRNVLANIFKYCELSGVLYVPTFLNDIENITIPKAATETKRRALTEEEQQRIIETPHRAQLPAMILLFTGLRRGELVPLTWADVDLYKCLINVNKSVELSDSKSTVKSGGKTINAVRVVPFAPILRDYLTEEKTKQFARYKENNPKISEFQALLQFENELICKTARGAMFTATAWRKLWDTYIFDLNLKYGYKDLYTKFDHRSEHRATKALPLKIEPFTAHYLRHTYATMLYYQNINVVDAKEILGHADIHTTVNIYTDLKKYTISDSYREKLRNEYKIQTA